jgi:hypothetical protein
MASTKFKQLPTRTPEQMALINAGATGARPGLEKGLGFYGSVAGGGTPELWETIEAPARRLFGQFQGATASRFSGGQGGEGAMSSRRSSGFYNTLAQGSQSLAENLQASRLALQQHAIDQLMNFSVGISNIQPFENIALQKQGGKNDFMKQMLLSILGSAGGIGRAFMGGF